MFKKILILLFLTVAPFIFPQEYYRSNSLGMELSKIPRFRADEFEYYIEKTINDNREKKILFKESVPIRETELYYLPNGAIEREITTENDIRTERTYNESLLYRERVINLSDQSGYVRIYKYNLNRLIDTVDELSLDGKLQSSLSYERDSRGRLISVVKSIYLGSDRIIEDQISKYRFEEQNLLEEWHGNDELTGTFIYYNRNGKISEILKTHKGKTESHKKYFYELDGKLSTEEFIYATDERIIQFFNPEGYFIEEFIYIKENLISRTNDYYDYDDRLVRRVRVLPEGVERYIFEYSGENLSSEKMFFNGEIYKEKVYLEDNAYYEDFFSNGEKILRDYYKDDEKIETEIW